MTVTLIEPEVSEEEVGQDEDENRASQLPEPSGFRILIALPEVKEMTEGGIYKPEDVRKIEEVATVVGFVLKLGPDAYADEKRFPTGPWCLEGDWVLFRAFTGTRVRIHGKEFRLINDDSVEAVVRDPHGIVKA